MRVFKVEKGTSVILLNANGEKTKANAKCDAYFDIEDIIFDPLKCLNLGEPKFADHYCFNLKQNIHTKNKNLIAVTVPYNLVEVL